MTGRLIAEKKTGKRLQTVQNKKNTPIKLFCKCGARWCLMLFLLQFFSPFLRIVVTFDDPTLNVDVLRGPAACVKSLFLLLLWYSLCSDMFLSPSSKFPSLREKSEVRDCDLPWGWVKDSLPPPPPPLHLLILYTPESLILSWINWQSAERAAVSSFQLYFGLFRKINKCSSDGCMESLCLQKKKSGKRRRYFTESFDQAAEKIPISLHIQWT